MITMMTIWWLWWWSYRSHIQQAQYLAMTWRLEASLPTDHLRPSLFKIVPWLYLQKMHQPIPLFKIVPKLYPTYIYLWCYYPKLYVKFLQKLYSTRDDNIVQPQIKPNLYSCTLWSYSKLYPFCSFKRLPKIYLWCHLCTQTCAFDATV